ncbi:MAG TPA: hypothetical protein DCS87_11655 [Rheinheimera sp.]|nr:hypothetical protein [Rheinheimera sp.]
MSKITFKLEGFSDIKQKLEAMKVEMRDRTAKDCLGRAAEVILDEAKLFASGIDDPKTGRRISDNIIKEFGSKVYRRSGKRVAMWRVGVRTRFTGIQRGNPDEGAGGNTPHWHMVELGTKRQKEQPFLRRAMRSKGGAFFNRFRDELERRIRRLGKRASK